MVLLLSEAGPWPVAVIVLEALLGGNTGACPPGGDSAAEGAVWEFDG